jgi:LacI family transcriptional regulator
VSQATVSAVTNRTRVFSPKTRERVLQAIAQLGYRPNARARSLTTRSSRVIGVAIPDVTFSTQSSLVPVIDQTVVLDGYRVVLVDTFFDPSREARGVDDLIDVRVAGLILVPSSGTEVEKMRRIARNIPTVVLNRRSARVDVNGVIVDDRSDARMATEQPVERPVARAA